MRGTITDMYLSLFHFYQTGWERTMEKKISGEGKKRIKKKKYKKRRRQTWSLKKLKQTKLHFEKEKIQVDTQDLK